MKLVLTKISVNSIKREITFEVATFGGSLLSGGRYFGSFTVLLLRILFPGKWI